MNKNTFEQNLPENYQLKLHIDAKNVKFGLIFNAISIVVFLLFGFIAFAFIRADESQKSFLIDYLTSNPFAFSLIALVFFFAMLIYIVLHELLHGAIYKIMTGEKLTFGLSWSCAFCGVPHIHVYRKTALLSSTAPLVIFSLIFLPLSIILYFVNPAFFIAAMLLFGLHLGGCAGDIYVILLLLFKFRDKKTLVKDTGPEQFFYTPDRNFN